MLFDFERLSGHDTYKLLVATIVPRPIAWITTLSPDGSVNAGPYSFFNVLSGDPPLLAIGVGARTDGAIKDTGLNIRDGRQFVVNMVPARLAEAMNVTAIDFPRGIDELAEAGLAAAPSTKVAPPRIADSPVALECEHFQTLEIGPERWLVLGRVVAMHLADAAVLDASRCYVDTPKLDLIGRMAGAGGYVRTTDVFDMPRVPLEGWSRDA